MNDELSLVSAVTLTGQETDEQSKELAWQMFCDAHPIEAHAHDPDKFWALFHSRAPSFTREQMVALLKECDDSDSRFATEGARPEQPKDN